MGVASAVFPQKSKIDDTVVEITSSLLNSIFLSDIQISTVLQLVFQVTEK